MRLLTALLMCSLLAGCFNFHAKGYTDTGQPNWKEATLVKDTPSEIKRHNCMYEVTETKSLFTVMNRLQCRDKVEIDINSWTFTTVGVPILAGGFHDSGFTYRPAMP